MVLVIAVICVIIYVFYVSRDILTIDKEIKNLRNQINLIQQHLVTPPLVQAQAQAQAQAQPSAFPHATKYALEAGADDNDEDDSGSIDSERIQQILDTIQAEQNSGDVSDAGAGAVAGAVVADDAGAGVGAATAEADVGSDAASDEDGGVEGDIDDDTAVEPLINKMTIMKLRSLCKENNITAKGSKEQLIERLEAALKV